MRVPAASVIAVVGAVLALSGCGSAARTASVPRTLVAPAMRAIRVAHASDDYSIFPSRPGKKFCLIPAGALTAGLRGTCQTRVYPSHLLQGPRFIVAFTEYWGYLCRKSEDCVSRPRRWHHTWRVSASTTRVGPTTESGAQDPATWK